MRKLLSTLCLVLVLSTLQAQNYQQALARVNDYLKDFDNGYYGYLEIKDGYLYDRFKDGTNYCKGKMSDLDYAFEKEKNRKVDISCKGNSNCVFSTYTNQDYNSFTFSQSRDFNTSELISLFNSLIASYKRSGNSEPSVNPSTYKATLDVSNNTVPGNYKAALDKLNAYLKTFDEGYYGYFEVNNGYIYVRFQSGKYDKFRMEDMEGAIVEENYYRVIFKCKYGSCVSTDWKENGKEEYIQFVTAGGFNYKELADLLNNFRDAYMGKQQPTNSTNKTTSTSGYTAALKKVNDYLRTFDGDRYQGLEIQDGYIYSRYKNNNYSRAKLDDIDKAVFNKEYNYIKLTCKNGSQCIYSTITGGYHDYFNFQTSTGKDLNKLYDLLTDFVSALNGKSTSASTTNSNALSIREQKDKERKQQTDKSKETESDDDYLDWLLSSPSSNTTKSTESNKVSTASTSSTKTTQSSNPNPSKYTSALNNLNAYLKTFNPETYKGVEVKEGKVYFKFFVFGTTYRSSIPIADLVKYTTVIKSEALGKYDDDEIKILCKNESKCFYSEYSKGPADHFRFFSKTVKDLSKMQQLVEDFIKALQ